MSGMDFTGLSPRPPQSWGEVQIVPLVRSAPIDELRLDARAVGEVRAVPAGDGSLIIGYVPHAYVATWTNDATPAATYGTQLLSSNRPPQTAEPTHGLVKRVRTATEDARRLRFLPLVLAIDGLLSIEFGGPTIAWPELSKRAVRQGLSPRVEAAIRGTEVLGLEDALRTFEIHTNQCGILLYVSGQLLSAFVVPHPDDYRALHASVVLDLYGDVMAEIPNGGLPNRTGAGDQGLTLPAVDSLDALRAELAKATASWAARASVTWLNSDLFGNELTFSPIYRMGGYTLSRFLPSLDRQRDNHLGELITGPDGRIAYLHTYRLNAIQVRRGRMLRALQAEDWNLARTAAAMSTDLDGFLVQLNAIGLADVVRRDILDAWRSRRRRPPARS